MQWGDRLAAIVVVFPAFRDGRGFSTAARLRERGFTGQLIASGDLLPDQAPLLARSGFDAVELPEGASVDEWRRALATFSAAYQSAAGPGPTVWSLRQSRQRPGPHLSLEDRVRALNAAYRDAPAEALLEAAIRREYAGRIAVLSSFGAEAAVTLHMAATIDASIPVLFIDTERHFAPTLQYRDLLVERLGLTDVRVLKPQGAEAVDPNGDLWTSNPDLCCHVRKVLPAAAASLPFEAVITGRKRMHGGERLRLKVFEALDGQVRINPLANWSAEQIEAYVQTHVLPRHPLTAAGYTSIGCWPCSEPSHSRSGDRSGRWAGVDKQECGIHLHLKTRLAEISAA
jgi:phosphoadenylyl-sulfate reductase (thioredoxin)